MSEPVRLYNVDLDCPRCGKLHWIYGGPGCGPLIPNDLDRAGTIAELYEGQDLPGALLRLMTDLPWCDQVQEYVPMDDPARVSVTNLKIRMIGAAVTLTPRIKT